MTELNRFTSCLMVVFFFLLSGDVMSNSGMEKRLVVNTKSRSYRQQLINVDSITHGRVSKEMFYSLPDNELTNGSVYDFTLLDTQIFLTKRCDFKVWVWSDSGWANLYNHDNSGWCISNRYIRNKELIGFTAKGFWTSQSGLYVFDKTLGNWDLLNTKNSPNSYFSSGDFKIGKDTIVSVFGIDVSLGQASHSDMMQGYGLDLQTHSWFRVDSKINLKAWINTLIGGVVFDFEESVYIVKGNTSLYIEKDSKKVYYRPIEYIADDKIEFCYNDCMRAVIMYGGVTKILVPQLEEDSKYMGDIFFTKIESIDELRPMRTMGFSWFWGGGILLVLGFVLGLFLMTNRKLKKRTQEKHMHSELIKRLMLLGEQLLTNQELDIILGITDELNADSKRVKRSRIIQEVNAEYQLMAGKEIIIRQRDPKDKRYMLYQVKR